ncbi:MAG: hypothetical protein J0M24_13740 [Verrucomicrobia bacterium]|nr:hypothetical protein [Verrucomicrobiota bacterium]
MPFAPLDLSQLRVRPLAERKSLTRADDIAVPVNAARRPLAPELQPVVAETAERIRRARAKGASVILMYGAHLLRNGAAPLVTALMEQGWITHLATNGAGTIHDWEYAWLGRSTESVEENVATGSFGTWDETGRNLHLALLAGALERLGYGRALGKFIAEDGCLLPSDDQLEAAVTQFPGDPLAVAAAELLTMMRRFELAEGRHEVRHDWKSASILAQAWRLQVPVTIHPGIGYDIISCHPMFNGAVIGRAAGEDFRWFAGAVEGLDQGVVLSVGSAIMAPQVFEKSLSCVHNLRFQKGRPAVSGHSIYVVDLQDGGGWDWTQGEPPKTNPAYYLRFCKSFSRMGGQMRYLQCDNLTFIQHVYHQLQSAA